MHSTLSALPYGVRTGVLDALHIDSWHLLQRSAGAVGVTTLGAVGKYGRIISSTADREVIRAYARDGQFAARTNDVIRSFFEAAGGSGTYVDVGANIGLTTIPVAQFPHVRCIAIEPDPANFANLKANIGENCAHGNITLHNCAIHAESGQLPLERSPDNAGDNRLRVQARPQGALGESTWTTVDVQAKTLDSLVAAPMAPLVVKVDVQGAEPYVIAGGRRTLAAANLLILEWAPYWLHRVGGDPEVVTDFLLETFRTLRLADMEEAPLQDETPSDKVAAQLLELYARYKHDPTKYLDVVATRG